MSATIFLETQSCGSSRLTQANAIRNRRSMFVLFVLYVDNKGPPTYQDIVQLHTPTRMKRKQTHLFHFNS